MVKAFSTWFFKGSSTIRCKALPELTPGAGCQTARPIFREYVLHGIYADCGGEFFQKTQLLQPNFRNRHLGVLLAGTSQHCLGLVNTKDRPPTGKDHRPVLTGTADRVQNDAARLAKVQELAHNSLVSRSNGSTPMLMVSGRKDSVHALFRQAAALLARFLYP